MERDQDVLANLRMAKEKHPELAEVIDLQHDLFETRMQVNVELAIPQYGPEEVQRRFGQGVPLVRPEEVTIDWETFSHLFKEVCHIAGQHRSDLATEFEELSRMPKDSPDKLRASAQTFLTDGRLELEEREAQGELLAFALHHTLSPFLRAYADALAPVVEQQPWPRGTCPVCGGEPDLAFLDDESGARHMICSRCDSQWLYPRTKCPFCITSDPTSLSYYPSEDEKYRLYVCQNCHRYLKTIDLRKRRKRVIPPVERITTVALDVAAREEGYR